MLCTDGDCDPGYSCDEPDPSYCNDPGDDCGLIVTNCYPTTTSTAGPTTTTPAPGTTTTMQDNACLYECDGAAEEWQLLVSNCNGGNTCQIVEVCDMGNDGELLWSSCGA